MTKYLTILFLLLFPAMCFGQETNLSDIIISTAEELADEEDDPEAVSVFIDRLQDLSENQVRINSANENEISRLFFLSDFQVKALVDYIHSTGQIVTAYELANIPGFDKEIAQMVIPFITLDNKNRNIPDSVRLRNSLISNFVRKSGNDNSTNVGSPWKVLTKYKITSGAFSGGITMEKDPGEKLIYGNPPLPDFLSANLAFNGKGLIRKVIIGDYSARFGLGTNINTGLRRGISLTIPGYMSANNEIKPYTSTDENRFFRGIAAEFTYKNLELSMFLSKNYIDATIDSSSGSESDFIDNFYIAGLHNTPSLLKKKDAVNETAFGLSTSYDFNNLKIGLVWSGTRLSIPVKLNGDDPEKIHDFTGDKNNLCTIFYNGYIRKFLLFGELSADNNKLAIVQGMSFSPSGRLILNFLYRNYFPGYTALYGQGPGTGSKTSNENGFLGNFTFEAARHLFISGGCDVQQFPWLKYRCSTPSRGIRKEIKIRFLPSEKLSVDAAYNYRFSMTDSTESQGIPEQEKLITRSFKTSVHYSVLDNLTLGTRFDFKIANPSGSRGMILFQDISYSFRKVPVTVWARYCLFNTDDWDSRIYTYENDLLYSYSVPALYGRGSRSYIMAKWKMADFAELRIKYGTTSTVMAGNSSENTDEIKMQFRLWF